MPYYQPAPQRVRPKPKPKNKSHPAIKVLLIVGLVMGGYHLLSNVSGLGKHELKASAVAPIVLSQAQISQMASKINAVIADNPNMQIGVSIQDLNSGQSYNYGVSQPFIAASTSKLLTAAMYLSRVQAGQYSLNRQIGGQSARYQLQQMIVNSDNDAWHSFNDLLTHDGLEAYANSIGLSNYDPNQNTLTVKDISLLLAKIYKGRLLNTANTNLLLSYMQDANEDNFIVASIPQGVKVYHKAGWLEDRIHDAAIIDNGKHPYVLVIFTKDNSGTYDSAQGKQIFSQITGATTGQFL